MSSSNSNNNNEQALMDIGTQCADPLCRLVDFLPFKCQHCTKSFCQEHFKVDAHKCTEYDEFKFNRVAPDCPFCHTPVAIAPNQDPNVRLADHFDNECSVLMGKDAAAAAAQRKRAPVCARGTCKKVLFSPILCETCRQVYCPSHRFPSDHTCTPPQSRLLAPSSSSSSSKPTSATAKRPSATGQSDTDKALKAVNAKATNAVSNVKKAAAAGSSSVAAKASAVAAVAPGMVKAKKTDRRAKAERDSRIRAMKAREAKGLLSAEDKLVLKELEDEVKADKDCVVM